MKLRTIIGRSEQEPVDDAQAKRLRELRVEAARRNSRWTELKESALVPRPPGFLVDAESDEVFRESRGAVYVPGEIRSSFAERTELYFVVRDGDVLEFLERDPRTWSQIVERQARRKLRAAT